MFAKLANADDCEEIEEFAECNKDFLRNYIDLENGIPSHNTIQRVIGNIAPQYMQGLYEKWCLSILKLFQVGNTKKEHYRICLKIEKYLEQILNI